MRWQRAAGVEWPVSSPPYDEADTCKTQVRKVSDTRTNLRAEGLPAGDDAPAAAGAAVGRQYRVCIQRLPYAPSKFAQCIKTGNRQTVATSGFYCSCIGRVVAKIQREPLGIGAGHYGLQKPAREHSATPPTRTNG